MSEKKATPGPWILDDANNHADVIANDYHFIDAGNGFHDTRTNQGFGIAGCMSIGDALLIAAAPDLLEALQGLMNHFNKASYDEAFAKARAAISKALGESSPPRFANVSCSACGAEFGPGDHGFSHCSHHGGKE